ncbi:hypothetical protein HYDPIDRAFT_25143 [Hydnomerulius pinastri MD-312]|nr:hypothetical protein HYDPIDRAFT_25143 [Hydnomerulius pinastri MD-312]
MTTWTQSVRHPWFDPPAMKRRLSSVEEDPSRGGWPPPRYPLSEPPSDGRQKKRKLSTLEHGFAHLTLSNAPPPTLSTSPSTHDLGPSVVDVSVARPGPPHPPGPDTYRVVLPSSVEEPTSPTPEIDMDIETDPFATNTYTATYPAEEQKDPKAGELEIKEVKVSSVVLERLKRQAKSPPPLIPISTPVSQALILFRPLRPPSPFSFSKELEDDDEPVSTVVAPLVVAEDDAMDVE